MVGAERGELFTRAVQDQVNQACCHRHQSAETSPKHAVCPAHPMVLHGSNGKMQKCRNPHSLLLGDYQISFGPISTY